MATTSSQPSCVMFLKLRWLPEILVPALVTSMSLSPWRYSISAASALRASLSETSSWIASASPSALSFFSASRLVFSVLPDMTTRAPALTSSSAPARPMPDPPPVIQATLPLSILRGAEQIFLLLLRHLRHGAAPLSEHSERLLHRRALEDRVAPALERRVVVDLHALAFREAQPGHGGHVGDRVGIAGEVLRFLEPAVDHHVQAVGLVLVAVHGVRDLLRRVAEEMVRLAEHGTDVAHLEHHPLHHLPALAQVGGQEAAGLRGEIEQHRARLGQREGLAARAVAVDHRRHLVVGGDLEEIRLELVAGADVDRVHVVGRARFLEHDVDFVAVRRRPSVEV